MRQIVAFVTTNSLITQLADVVAGREKKRSDHHVQELTAMKISKRSPRAIPRSSTLLNRRSGSTTRSNWPRSNSQVAARMFVYRLKLHYMPRFAEREEKVLVSSYNSLDGSRYYDVESQSSFAFNHTTQVKHNLYAAYE